MDPAPLAALEPGDRLPLEGALNFRDLGGYANRAGVTVRRGRLFRADRLGGLTDTDLDRLGRLGIRTVVDLRYDAEVSEHPNRLWPGVERHEHVPMAGALAKERSFLDRVFAGEVDAITVDDVAQSYLDMLEQHARDFGRVVEVLAAGCPAVFHCTAGKDRTGLTAMFVLSVLDVDEVVILEDFERSNRHRAERRIAELRDTFAARGLDVEDFRPALSAPRPALEAAIAWLEREVGGPERYLREVGGCDPDALATLRRELLDC
jgi:protein-tyrosine phosphatase